MIDRLRLTHYKGFNKFTLNIRGDSILVGPNNAGKTTIIACLRLCAYLLRHARAQRPQIPIVDDFRSCERIGYGFKLPVSQFLYENVRHEFRELETRIELRLKGDAFLHVIWPADAEADSVFYLEHPSGMQPRDVKSIRAGFPEIAVVPTVSPIDHRESLLTEKYVRENYTTRLVSRHFRNQLYWLGVGSKEFEEFRGYVLANTPEIEALSLALSTVDGETEPDIFYREVGAHTERELFWAGDGLQIWIQVLFHIWRQRDATILVLDEPDVFLHPDLQRRLVKILECLPSQVIMATHAPEILAEAAKESVVIVDRNKSTSRRIGDNQALSALNDVLGSGFNLRLAKALRSRVVLFVEGKDMKVLANIAACLGASRFAKEIGLTVVPMEGYSNRAMSSAFSWINNSFLDKGVKIVSVLDRDYRSPTLVAKHVDELKAAGVDARVWSRKELESYVIEPSAIARLSGLPIDLVHEIIAAAVDELRGPTMARLLAERVMEERSSGISMATTNEKAIADFDRRWADERTRSAVVPAKDLLNGMNARISQNGGKTVSARTLSKTMLSDEIAPDLRKLIWDVEEALTPFVNMYGR